ncbi:MAG: ribosomal protein S18-alanine N-acetyltransferase [Clostridiales bacterium]|nr:ribosomal protein S18-alanine N-acetyltransferase [Clostridiales bacterium]
MFAIVPFSADYTEPIEKIENACFSVPWTRQGIESELENKTARFFVAVEENQTVGYIGAHFILDEGYIANLAVLEEYRHKGIATALLKKVLALADEEKLDFVSLEVRQSNFGAIALYEKNGFERVGVRKKFYSNPEENAVIMTNFIKENI